MGIKRMDHYKELGLNKSASKEEIKEAFRKLAVQFHPDKHSQSPKAVRDCATLRFKQVSQAYEVLSDDRKRANYDISRYSVNNNHTHSRNHSKGGGYGYGSYYNNNPGYRAASASATNAGDGFVSKLEIALRFLTSRSFLLNCAIASTLLGGIYVSDKGRDALWKMQNSGACRKLPNYNMKTFEAAMESIEKAKANAHKDKM